MNEIEINQNRIDLDEAYLQMAEVWARRSKANRLQVGCLIVKDKQIISDGYNGMPAGSPNDVCEVYTNGVNINDGLRTKREVLHAESNALMKLAENGGTGVQGATLYTTWSPCFECAKLIRQAKIQRVVFRNAYRDMDGVQFLHDSGVIIEQLTGSEPSLPKPVVVPAPKPTVQAPSPKPVVVASPPPTRSFSMLQAVAGGQDEVSRLRAAQAATRAPVEASDVPEVVIGQTDFTPLVGEDEVAALLRAHEAASKTEAVSKPQQTETTEGPYHSNFL